MLVTAKLEVCEAAFFLSPYQINNWGTMNANVCGYYNRIRKSLRVKIILICP